MALTLPFMNGPTRKKRSHIISVDLGSRTTKAVLIERRGDTLALTRYALLEAPIYEKKISPEQLGDHLHTVVEALGSTTKFVCVAMGINDTIVRQVELPQIPLDDMRTVLKMNHKSYLQQDLPNHTFDCYVIPPSTSNGTTPKPGEGSGSAAKKLKVLVAAAKEQLISDFMQATSSNGLQPDILIPSLVGPINAFEAALPEIYRKETVALVDIGFRNSSICVLDRGDLVLNRVVSLGGDQITAGLAEARGGIPYAEAEGIKVGMPQEVESDLQTQIMPLGQEIRAVLNFFEHQHDRPVSQVYVSGGTARSDVIVQMLQAETMVECKSWNPTSCLQLALPSQQAAEIDHISPQLAVAIGTALASY